MYYEKEIINNNTLFSVHFSFAVSQDFLVNQIHEEQQKASSLTSQVPRDAVTMAPGSSEERQMLASPLMFLRKWLGEVRENRLHFILELCLDINGKLPNKK